MEAGEHTAILDVLGVLEGWNPRKRHGNGISPWVPGQQPVAEAHGIHTSERTARPRTCSSAPRRKFPTVFCTLLCLSKALSKARFSVAGKSCNGPFFSALYNIQASYLWYSRGLESCITVERRPASQELTFWMATNFSKFKFPVAATRELKRNEIKVGFEYPVSKSYHVQM